MDSTGRIKLSPAFLRGLQTWGDGPLVLQCLLAEGALGLYPRAEWDKERERDLNQFKDEQDSAAYRRMLRFYGAFSCSVEISNQGRITLPTNFRAQAGLPASGEILVAGCDTRLEIWALERFQAESEVLATAHKVRGSHSMARWTGKAEAHV